MVREHNDVRAHGKLTAALFTTVLAILSLTSWYVWHAKSNADNVLNQAAHSSITSIARTDQYSGWQTYEDTGYPLASKITIKYPPGWTVTKGGKSTTWQIVQEGTGSAIISTRIVYLDNSQSPKQEWNGCTSADSCGASEGDIILETNELRVNGLAAYKIKGKNTGGIFFTTVLKSDKSDANGTAFIELTTYNSDPQTLHTYNQILKTAHF